MEQFLEKCGKCNLTLSQQEMKQHNRTHVTEASFPCDVCHSKFLQVTKLLKHIDNAEHIGLNCGICQTKTETEAACEGNTIFTKYISKNNKIQKAGSGPGLPQWPVSCLWDSLSICWKPSIKRQWLWPVLAIECILAWPGQGPKIK